MKYWIEYVDSTCVIFEAENDKEARHYFMMEGDHAHDYGLFDESVRVGPCVTVDKNGGRWVNVEKLLSQKTVQDDLKACQKLSRKYQRDNAYDGPIEDD